MKLLGVKNDLVVMVSFVVFHAFGSNSPKIIRYFRSTINA